ncbi:MAG: hypothetical protein HQM10_07815 [Candidatus Riflebacteria bacterium]|nr:hypothetical protein [Candidatus Riflebacteria bacterium]
MDNNTLLLRQVHPSWVVGDTISQQAFSSQTFKPTPKDEGLLSVYNGNQFDANSAYDHYINEQKLQSAGVVAVTHEECSSVPVPVLEDNLPFAGHCSIDYRELSGSAVKKTAALLKSFAQVRGWLYKRED